MLMDLKKPIVAGETVKLVLVFEKAGEITVDAKVEPIGGPRGAGTGSGSGAGSKGSH